MTLINNQIEPRINITWIHVCVCVKILNQWYESDYEMNLVSIQSLHTQNIIWYLKFQPKSNNNVEISKTRFQFMSYQAIVAQRLDPKLHWLWKKNIILTWL